MIFDAIDGIIDFLGAEAFDRINYLLIVSDLLFHKFDLELTFHELFSDKRG